MFASELEVNRRNWKTAGRGLGSISDSTRRPQGGESSEARLIRTVSSTESDLRFIFRPNCEEHLHLILGLFEKSNNGGGRLFDLQSSGSDGLHCYGSVLRCHSLCSCFVTSSTTSSFSSSLHDSTVPVRLHFHRRFDLRLRSNPSCKLQSTFSCH